jgi:SH3-like domain-containing protein
MDAQSYPERLIARAVVPMFRAPDLLSEQVSQALLGQTVQETGGRDEWRLIRTPDGYQGWAPADALVDPPADWGPPWAEVTDLWANLRADADYRLAAAAQAMIGTRLPVLVKSLPGEPIVAGKEGWTRLRHPDGRSVWTEDHRLTLLASKPVRPGSPSAAVRTARRFLGVPYLWGGSSPMGLDCSGFVQLVLRLHGVELRRDAHLQFEDGVAVDLPDAADLVFFGPEGEPGRITHVGMMLDRRRFIHAAGSDRVRINRLDDEPYRAMFRGARRFLGAG